MDAVLKDQLQLQTLMLRFINVKKIFSNEPSFVSYIHQNMKFQIDNEHFYTALLGSFKLNVSSRLKEIPQLYPSYQIDQHFQIEFCSSVKSIKDKLVPILWNLGKFDLGPYPTDIIEYFKKLFYKIYKIYNEFIYRYRPIHMYQTYTNT